MRLSALGIAGAMSNPLQVVPSEPAPIVIHSRRHLRDDDKPDVQPSRRQRVLGSRRSCCDHSPLSFDGAAFRTPETLTGAACLVFVFGSALSGRDARWQSQRQVAMAARGRRARSRPKGRSPCQNGRPAWLPTLENIDEADADFGFVVATRDRTLPNVATETLIERLAENLPIIVDVVTVIVIDSE